MGSQGRFCERLGGAIRRAYSATLAQDVAGQSSNYSIDLFSVDLPVIWLEQNVNPSTTIHHSNVWQQAR